LSRELPALQIDFWTPTPWNISKLEKGDRLYFLLKAPFREIGGYGHFSYYKNMSAKEAWNRFGKVNGAYDLAELIAKTSGYATRHSTTSAPTQNPEMGCIVLDHAVFFEESQLFRPEDPDKPFPRQIVRLKYFDEDFDVDSLGGAEPPVGSRSEGWVVVQFSVRGASEEVIEKAAWEDHEGAGEKEYP
jgi:putative restriction endonuclease